MVDDVVWPIFEGNEFYKWKFGVTNIFWIGNIADVITNDDTENDKLWKKSKWSRCNINLYVYRHWFLTINKTKVKVVTANLKSICGIKDGNKSVNGIYKNSKPKTNKESRKYILLDLPEKSYKGSGSEISINILVKWIRKCYKSRRIDARIQKRKV